MHMFCAREHYKANPDISSFVIKGKMAVSLENRWWDFLKFFSQPSSVGMKSYDDILWGFFFLRTSLCNKPTGQKQRR